MTLYANVSGQLEGKTLTVWRYNAGNGWVVAATNTMSHSYVVDETNYTWTWDFRITVIVDGAE